MVKQSLNCLELHGDQAIIFQHLCDHLDGVNCNEKGVILRPKRVGKKIGLNCKCPCDSGKKYKKCCALKKN